MFFVVARRVSYMDVANNIVPDDFFEARPADYEIKCLLWPLLSITYVESVANITLTTPGST